MKLAALLGIAAAALLAWATLLYATHRHVREYPMEPWDEGDEAWCAGA